MLHVIRLIIVLYCTDRVDHLNELELQLSIMPSLFFRCTVKAIETSPILNQCIYCGSPLQKRELRAHVFPKNLRTQFPIYGSSIQSIKGYGRHRSLMVPTCRECSKPNSADFDELFAEPFFKRPLSAARNQARNILAWSSKILIGLTHLDYLTEVEGHRDRKKSFLLRIAHLSLQSLRSPIDFRNQGKPWLPGSIFVFDLHCPESAHDQFSIHYDASVGVSMRLGSRGIIAVVDGGALNDEFGHFFLDHSRRRLHPVQFLELGAVAFYRSSLLRHPRAIKVSRGLGLSLSVEKNERADETGASNWKLWKQRDFAPILSAFTGLPVDVLNPNRGKAVLTWIADSQGAPLKLDLKKLPFCR